MIFAVEMPMSVYWQLPLLLLVISLVYSTTRFDDWDQILNEAFRWGSRMFAFMVAIAVVLYVASLVI